MMSGAMINRFDISGSISGTKAAIYIADNAHVEEINLMDPNSSLLILGDIISDYDAIDSNDNPRTTLLSFGQLADANGEANGAADENFDFTYHGNITGNGLFDLQTYGGTTSLTGNQLDRFNDGLVKTGSTLNLQGMGTVVFNGCSY